MTASNPAAQALVEALKDPSLQPAQRQALLGALRDLHEPVVSASPRGAATPATLATRPKKKAERRADSVRLSREAIAAMPLPAEGERYVYDTAVPQLAVRCRPGGRTFVVVAWDRERQRTVKTTLGKVESLTPEQARKRAQQLVARVAEGEDVRRPVVEALTLAELIEAWHAERRHSVRTADEMRDKALHYLGALAHRRASEVERQDIGRIHHHIATAARKRVWKRVGDELRAVEVGPAGSPATADKLVAVVCSIFAWGVSKGLVQENPASRIAKAYDAKSAARSRYLAGDELVRAWRAIEADPDEDVRDVLMLALLTGQRRGNVLGMRWAAIDLDAGTWTVDAKGTKQKAAQTTPLTSQAREILARRFACASGVWVFPGRVSKDGEAVAMSETRVRQAWARICKAAEIEDLRVHDLRHSQGAWLASLNVSEAIRQRALGHRDSRSAARYGHVQIDPVAAALQQSADAMEAVAKARPPAAVKRIK